MKREDFKTVIRFRCDYEIIKDKGNYRLPNSNMTIKAYIMMLIEGQMEIDFLGINEAGDLVHCTGGKWTGNFSSNGLEYEDFYLSTSDSMIKEICSYEEMQNRKLQLLEEIINN